MSHELAWHLPGEVLQLNLQNGLSLEEMQKVNQQTTEVLEGTDGKLILLVDVSALAAGYQTADHLRTTQQYRDHPNLDSIVVVGSNKLNRLVALLAFHLSRAHFVQFDSQEQAHLYVQRRAEQRQKLR